MKTLSLAAWSKKIGKNKSTAWEMVKQGRVEGAIFHQDFNRWTIPENSLWPVVRAKSKIKE